MVGPFASNCYIVGSKSTKEGMIIDPGAEPEEILKSVKDLGLDIKFIVLGHNTIRGAAGASVLNAELMLAQGMIDT